MQKQTLLLKFRSRLGSRAFAMLLGLLGVAATSLLSQSALVGAASAFQITLDVPSSVTLNVDPSSNGGYGESSSSSLQVSTTSPGGFKLQMHSKESATNDLVLNDAESLGVSHKIRPIGQAIESQSASASFGANTWGYKTSKFNGMSNTSFRPAPSSSSSDTIDTTNNNTQQNYNLSIAAKVNNEISAGEYSNTYVFMATANTISYNITYQMNGGSPAIDADHGSTSSNQVKISSVTPTRSDGDYRFEGWCTQPIPADSYECSGETIQPGGTLTLTGAENNVTLYAIWREEITYHNYGIFYSAQGLMEKNWPNHQTGALVPANKKVQLRPERPTRDGFTFKGWCDIINKTDPSSCTSSGGHSFQPSQEINIASPPFTLKSEVYEMTLYAMWGAGSSDEEGEDMEIIPPSAVSSYLDCSSSTIPDAPVAAYGDTTWTMARAACDWESAVNACPAGFHLPSEAELQNLLAVYGTGYGLYNAGWNEANGGESAYWSATVYTDGGDTLYSEDASGARTYASSLYVGPDYARVGYGYSYDSPVHYVRCVAN